ncbi:hypothetical protein AB0L64_17580 [Kribbella sp. NPDC051936]|uniref:hypothetical protein n=1 Tax=Kribbella sp. NPDC051936 TaxID=3154946 RepID=UPI00343EBD37
MSDRQGGGLLAAQPRVQWELDRNRYDIKLPAAGAEFGTFVGALVCLATDDATMTLTATREDQKVVRRTWTGRCTSDEFALMLAEARLATIQARYADGSDLWLDLPGTGRWRWSTSGAAHDAAFEFLRILQSKRRRRQFRLTWPLLVTVAAVLAIGAWSREVPAASPTDPAGTEFYGPWWYLVLCILLGLAGLFAFIAADPGGFGGLGKRRYLRRLTSGQPFSWRRYVTFGKLDITNGVGAGLLIGVLAGVLGVLLVGK